MDNLYISVVIIISVFVLYRVRVNGKKFRELEEELMSVKLVADAKEPSRSLEHQLLSLNRKSYETHKKHMIIVNSDQNVVQLELPYKFKNVVHVELISGIFPKSEKRINTYNNNMNVDAGTTITFRDGSYTDIISLLMQINQELYDAGKHLMFLYDSVDRSLIALSNPTDPSGSGVNEFDFNIVNSISGVLGFENGPTSNLVTSTFTPSNDLITSSLNFMSDLKTKSLLSNKAINNLPSAVYTFTDQFYYIVAPATDPSININPNWKYIRGPKRVNMKHQLYLDVEIDEIEYWDGTHRLARVFIPESSDETEYRSYGNPIRRSFREEYKNLDKLTFRLKSVVSEHRKHDYELNGLNYSLQVEVVTVNSLLDSGHTILSK